MWASAKRMGDTLVCADGSGPDLALLGVLGCLVDCIASDAATDGAHQDPLGVQAGEHLTQSLAGFTDDRVLADLDVVEEHA